MRDALQKQHDVRVKMDANDAPLENVAVFSQAEDTPLSQFEKDSIRQKGFFEKADREDDRIGLTGKHPDNSDRQFAYCYLNSSNHNSAVSEEEKLQMKVQNLLDKETFDCQAIIARTISLILSLLEESGIERAELKEQAVTCLARLMLIK